PSRPPAPSMSESPRGTGHPQSTDSSADRAPDPTSVPLSAPHGGVTEPDCRTVGPGSAGVLDDEHKAGLAAIALDTSDGLSPDLQVSVGERRQTAYCCPDRRLDTVRLRRWI